MLQPDHHPMSGRRCDQGAAHLNPARPVQRRAYASGARSGELSPDSRAGSAAAAQGAGASVGLTGAFLESVSV